MIPLVSELAYMAAEIEPTAIFALKSGMILIMAAKSKLG
jgi:hypothetical protein